MRKYRNFNDDYERGYKRERRDALRGLNESDNYDGRTKLEIIQELRPYAERIKKILDKRGDNVQFPIGNNVRVKFFTPTYKFRLNNKDAECDLIEYGLLDCVYFLLNKFNVTFEELIDALEEI